MSRNVLLIAAIVVIAGYFYLRSDDRSQEIISSQTNQEQTDTQTQESSTDSEDAILVQNLMKEGIVDKINTEGDTPEVYVTADYYRIPAVDKTAIMEVLFKYLKAQNPDTSSFTMLDAKSGDMVGTYDADGFKTN